MAVDGSLKFDTKVDTDGVEKGARTVKEVMEDVVDSIEDTGNSIVDAFNDGSTKIDGFIKKINQSEKELNDLQDSMRKLSNEHVPSETFTQLQKEIQQAENQLFKYYERRDKLEYLGTDKESKAWKSLAYDIEGAERKLQMLEGDMKNLKSLGMDTVLGNQSKEFRDMEIKANKLKQRITEYNQKLMESKTVHLQSATATRQLDSEVSKYDKTAKKIIPTNNKMGKSMDKTSRQTSGLSRTFKMLGMSIMFSLVFRAITSINNAVKEGIQNLAQYSPAMNKSMSALATSLQTLKNSFATAFSPILTAITPALQTLINYLAQAITYMGQFFAVLLTGATTFTKAKDAQIDYAKSLAKTAKESNNALSPIDKLNQVSDNGSSGGSSGPLPTEMFEEVKINPKVLKFIENMKKKLEPLINAFDRFKIAVAPFSKNVGQGLKWFLNEVLVPLGNWTITKALPSFLDLLGGAINVLNSVIEVFKPYGAWLWDNFLKPLAIWTGNAIIDGLSLLTDSLYKLSDWIMNNQESILNAAIAIGVFFAAFKIAELVTWLAPLISGFIGMVSSGQLVSSILTTLGSLFGGLSAPIIIAVAIIGELIYSFIDLYRNSEEFRSSIKELGATWASALEPLATFVKTVLTDAWDKILKPVIDYFLTDLLPKLHETFKNLWQKVLVPLGNFIGTVLTPIFKIIGDLLTSLWKNIVLPLAKSFGTTLKEALNAIYTIFNKTIIPIVNKVIEVLTWLWKNVINPIITVLWDSFKPAFDGVFSAIGKLITNFNSILQGLIKFITGVFTGDWKKAWEGVKQIFKGIFDSLVTVVKAPINLIIDIINGLIGGIATGINTVIKGINKLSFEMPDWLGGGKVGFNLQTMTAPKIPKLATGAVIPPNNEFLAILGDQKKGTNIEAPLDTIVEAFKAVVGTNGSGNGTDLHLHVYEDGKLRFEQTVRYEKENYNRTGKSIFVH